MTTGHSLACVMLCAAAAFPLLANDRLVVTTNWSSGVTEQVLAIDPESGERRVLWSGGADLDAIVSPDGARLFVSGVDIGSEVLAEVDARNGAVLRKIEIPQVIRWIHPSTPGMQLTGVRHGLGASASADVRLGD